MPSEQRRAERGGGGDRRDRGEPNGEGRAEKKDKRGEDRRAEKPREEGRSERRTEKPPRGSSERRRGHSEEGRDHRDDRRSERRPHEESRGERGERNGSRERADDHRRARKKDKSSRGGPAHDADPRGLPEAADAAAASADPRQGRRQIDEFLDEIKAKHEAELETESREVYVRKPDRALRAFIDVLARYVAKYGEDFEEAVRMDIARRRRDILDDLGCGDDDVDLFSFLTDHDGSSGARYYRWKTFSLAQGDSQRRWHTEPFQMCREGAIWHPPPEERSDSSLSHSRSRSRSRHRDPRSRAERERDVFLPSRSCEKRRRRLDRRKGLPAGTGTLERQERRQLSKLLEVMGPTAGAVSSTMCWCLDHADCAVEVARLLMQAVLADALSFEERLARLFLVSDILHNAGSTVATSAWCYRREFEVQLPAVFEALRVLLLSSRSAEEEERVQQRVLRMLYSWQIRGVFTPQFVKGLETAFFKDIVSAESILPPAARPAGSPEALLMKLAEWHSQHFSQLEKLGRLRGLNWQTVHLQRPSASDGRSLEEVRKMWLLDRLVTYELYAWETRHAPPPPGMAGAPRPGSDPTLLLSGGSRDGSAARVRGSTSGAHVRGAAGDVDGEDLDGLDGSSLSSGDEAFLLACMEQFDADAAPLRKEDGVPVSMAARGPTSMVRAAGVGMEEADDDLDGVPTSMEEVIRLGIGRAPSV